jgi:hypothetical protein
MRNHPFLFFPHVLLGLGIVFPLASPVFGGWSIENVDGGFTYHSSLKLDPLGRPVIAFGCSVFQLARWDGNAWRFEDVDATSCEFYYPSLALDGADYPAISYYDYTNEDLKFARWNGTAWDIETVDSEGYVGWDTSLALDAAGNPAISYYDYTNEDLKFARWNGTAWDIETVDSEGYVGWDTSLALDAAGNPAISFFDWLNFDQGFARWNGSKWKIETVDNVGPAGKYSSLALDAAGNPIISYYNSCQLRLRLARFIPPRPAILYRGVAADLSPGWQAAALPLTDANDEVNGGFPLLTTMGGMADDSIVTSAPLVLYRILLDGTSYAGNALRTVKKPGSVDIRF